MALLFLGMLTELADVNGQDSNKNLYLQINSVEDSYVANFGEKDEQAKQPSDNIYKTNSELDLYKLFSIPYINNEQNTGKKLYYWLKFGGYGDPTITDKSPFDKFGGDYSACIDNTNLGNVAYATGQAGQVTSLVYKNVRVPGYYTRWATRIYIDLFSQCSQSGTGTWWKFERILAPDEAYQFSSTNNNLTYKRGINNRLVNLSFHGNPGCEPWTTYGCR